MTRKLAKNWRRKGSKRWAMKLLLVGSVPLDTVEEVMHVSAGRAGPLSAGAAGRRDRRAPLLGQPALLSHLQRPRRSRNPQAAEAGRRRRAAAAAAARRCLAVPRQARRRARALRQSRHAARLCARRGRAPISSSARCARRGSSPPVCASRSRSRWSTAWSAALFPGRGRSRSRIRPGFEEALAAESAVILERIPHQDLAIQWDCAWEVQAVCGGRGRAPRRTSRSDPCGADRAALETMPDDVQLGFHFCFGTFGGWPAFAPETLGRPVDLANASSPATGRRVDWIHIPTLDRADDAFYAPLERASTRAAPSLISARSITWRR